MQARKPIRRGTAIVIGKCKIDSLGLVDPKLPRAGATLVLLDQQPNVEPIPERGHNGLERIEAAIVDNDHFKAACRKILVRQGLQKSAELSGPVPGGYDNRKDDGRQVRFCSLRNAHRQASSAIRINDTRQVKNYTELRLCYAREMRILLRGEDAVKPIVNSPTLDPVRDEFSRYGPPVIVFNKSHSGSRMLAELLDAAGVFMGSSRNESWDSLPLVELVEYLVTRYYPDYSPLWDALRAPDLELTRLLKTALRSHLDGFDPDRIRTWGWKLCETAYVLPVLDYCFPRARFIHLIRDGRDVAFCDHKAPDEAFWRKIYFNTDRIRTYGGLRLTAPAYRRRSYLFNAVHWVNSVTVGRGYGAMLRDRYLEVRYEDLCQNLSATATPLLKACGIADPAAAIAKMQPGVYDSSIGKHNTRQPRHLRRVLQIEKTLLLELGYLKDDLEPARGFHWADTLIDRWKTRL
jgi:Sulfotransferase family